MKFPNTYEVHSIFETDNENNEYCVFITNKGLNQKPLHVFVTTIQEVAEIIERKKFGKGAGSKTAIVIPGSPKDARIKFEKMLSFDKSEDTVRYAVDNSIYGYDLEEKYLFQ